MPLLKSYLTYQVWESPEDLVEFEVEVEVDFTITSYGSSASYWSPGDPPEWEIDEVECEGHVLNLTDEQLESLDEWIGEKGDFDPDYGDD